MSKCERQGERRRHLLLFSSSSNSQYKHHHLLSISSKMPAWPTTKIIGNAGSVASLTFVVDNNVNHSQLNHGTCPEARTFDAPIAFLGAFYRYCFVSLLCGRASSIHAGCLERKLSLKRKSCCIRRCLAAAADSKHQLALSISAAQTYHRHLSNVGTDLTM